MILLMDLVDNEDDKNLFEEIYYKYRNLCYSVAYEILQDEMLSEDAVQETFERAARNFDKISKNYNEDCLKTKNYLVIICRRVSIDFLRSKKTSKVNLFDDPDDINDIEDEHAVSLEAGHLSEALKNISKEDSDLILMRYAYDLSFEQISDILGLRASSVRKKLSRARNRLERALRREYND